MLTLFWVVFWAGLTALVLLSGVLLRARLRKLLGVHPPQLDDDAVRRIVEAGTLTDDQDEPLDMRRIDEEERRFLSETWDEPEEW